MSGEGGTQVYFYHLERRSLEQTLPTLLQLSLKRGWRAVVQAASADDAASAPVADRKRRRVISLILKISSRIDRPELVDHTKVPTLVKS